MKGLSRALVDPVVRERNLVAKQFWIGTRKALCISSEPVPQTDTGRQEEDSKANGRRGAHESEPQRIGPGNCLAKTQVSAKSKDDV